MLLLMLMLTFFSYYLIAVTTKPWTAQVNTVTDNSCCFGNTSGFTPEISGFSSDGSKYHSRVNLRDYAGVDCGDLDDDSCIICFMNATLANNGFVLKCALTEDHYQEISVDSVKLNVVFSSITTQDLPTSTSVSNTHSSVSFSTHNFHRSV